MTCARISQFRANVLVCLIAPLMFAAPAIARQYGWGPISPYDGYWSHIDVPEIARLGPGDTGQTTPTRPGMTAPIDEIDDWSMDPRPGSDFDGGFVITTSTEQIAEPNWGSLGWYFVVPEPYDFIDPQPLDMPARLALPDSLLPTFDSEWIVPAPEPVVSIDWGAAVPGPASLGLFAAAVVGFGLRRRR